jgi:hypothetical protein
LSRTRGRWWWWRLDDNGIQLILQTTAASQNPLIVGIPVALTAHLYETQLDTFIQLCLAAPLVVTLAIVALIYTLHCAHSMGKAMSSTTDAL